MRRKKKNVKLTSPFFTLNSPIAFVLNMRSIMGTWGKSAGLKSI
jgi:hypothetical protein